MVAKIKDNKKLKITKIRLNKNKFTENLVKKQLKIKNMEIKNNLAENLVKKQLKIKNIGSNTKTTKTKDKITVVAVVGLPSSGKSSIAKHLAEKYGFYHIETGNIVRDFAKQERSVANKKNVLWAATYLFKKYKDKYIIDKVIEKIEKQKKRDIKKFVVSGIKTIYSYKQLNKLLGPFKQLAVNLDADMRYKRSKNRNRYDDEGADSRANFNKRTRRELKQGMGNILAISNYFIDNSGSLENSHKQVDEVMKKMKIKPTKNIK